jgi:hypothetical protein
MNNSYHKYYFYNSLSGVREKNYQPELDKKESERNQAGSENNHAYKQDNTISFLGLKLSYAKAFGIVFLIIFLLLFFPGIGVSSSAVKNKAEIEDMDKDNSSGETKSV